MSLHLQLRTPLGLLLDQPIRCLRAEDRSGWFGVLPGRTDLVASLPAGLLVFQDAEGEGFVALSGGLLELMDGRCRVLTREALWSRDLDKVSDAVDELIASGRERRERTTSVFLQLVQEAVRRLAREQRA